MIVASVVAHAFFSKKSFILLAWWHSLLFTCMLSACGKEENITSLLNIVITDSPVDAQNISEVNVVISDIEWKKNNTWRSIQYFERPVAVNVFSLTEGKLFPLVNRYVEAGRHTEFRFTFQTASKGGSLIINPQSNIKFNDDMADYLYWYNDEPTKMIVETDVTIPSRQFCQLVVDLDLRKSIRTSESGEYIFEPEMRIVNAAKSGSVDVTVTNFDEKKAHVVGYVYQKGVFSNSELAESGETVAFSKSVTSGRLNPTNKLFFSFLNPSEYELIFVSHTPTGAVEKVLKEHSNVLVKEREVTKVMIDMS